MVCVPWVSPILECQRVARSPVVNFGPHLFRRVAWLCKGRCQPQSPWLQPTEQAF